MNLYQEISSNNRKTYFLIFSFAVLIIILGWFLSYLFQTPILLVFAVIFSILTSFFSYWYSDKIVLKLTKAQPIKKEDFRDFFNIVENLSIASGMQAPKIYLIQEEQPNAFATGRNEKNSVIVVTTGLLKLLNKNEIEGVISHELSHIKNRDILLGTVVVVLVGVIVLVSDLIIRLTLWGGFKNRDSNDKLSIGALLVILGFLFIILSPILAKIIQFAVSRKREFLADSSAVLLTRYPDGLISALEKISNYPHSAKIANNATAHLFIENPFRGKENKSLLVRLFSTHPSLEERIAKLREITF
jgi:heat shock protein HtpX